jgi:hypothetical protein
MQVAWIEVTDTFSREKNLINVGFITSCAPLIDKNQIVGSRINLIAPLGDRNEHYIKTVEKMPEIQKLLDRAGVEVIR